MLIFCSLMIAAAAAAADSSGAAAVLPSIMPFAVWFSTHSAACPDGDDGCVQLLEVGDG